MMFCFCHFFVWVSTTCDRIYCLRVAKVRLREIVYFFCPCFKVLVTLSLIPKKVSQNIFFVILNKQLKFACSENTRVLLQTSICWVSSALEFYGVILAYWRLKFANSLQTGKYLLIIHVRNDKQQSSVDCVVISGFTFSYRSRKVETS